MDTIIESIKPFGRAQQIYCLIIGLTVSITGSAFYSSVFYIAEPELKCNALGVVNITKLNTSICSMWKNFTESQLNNQISPYTCYFEDEYYNLTIVNSMRLVCDKQNLLSMSQTLFFIGSICSIVNGVISDRIGRKKSCVYFVAIYTLALIVNQLLVIDLFFELSQSSKFIVYCVFQLISGFLNYCIFSVAYVLLFELITESYRIPLSNVYVYFFVLGEFFLMISFYFTKNYIITNWILVIFASITLVLFWVIVPESPKYEFDKL
jgi:MFS family permease